MGRLGASAVAAFCLAYAACSDSKDFDAGKAKEILEANAVNLDGEQVTISPKQLDCGVQSELWDSPSQISQDRSTARLSSKGKELNFSDDPVTEPGYRQPHAQIRGAFMLEVNDVSGIRNGDENGTKLVDAKVGIKLQDACFSNPLPLMGVKHGNFQENTPVSFLFRLSNDGWHLEKLLH